MSDHYPRSQASPILVLRFEFNIAEEREKRGRPGLIHHVSDVRWTRCGRDNDVRGRALLLPCIILNANRRTKMGEAK